MLALVMFAALGGTASADVFDDNPAAVSLGPGNVELFARGPDSRILHRTLNGGAWGDWRPVDGLSAGSGPAAVVYGTSIYLFARGTDGALWQNLLQNGAWSGWVSLGGGLTSAPAAGLRRSSSTIDVFARGLDNSLFHRALIPGQGWSPWEALGGNMTWGPAAVGFSSSGSIDVFVPDNSGLRWKYWLGSWYQDPEDPTWGWGNKGGGIRGAATTASPANNVLSVYVRGLDDALHFSRHTGETTSWMQVDKTPLASSPAATSDRTGHEYLFARIGSDLHVREINAAETSTQDWGTWSSIGPVALPTPPAPPAPPAPAPPPAPLQTLTPRLTWSHKVSRRSTKLSALRLSRISSGATVKITCSKGCSAKRWTTKPKKSTLSLARFTRRSIKVGRSIRVQVTKPGTIGSVKTLKIRSRKAPSVIDRCLPPGAKAPRRCAT